MRLSIQNGGLSPTLVLQYEGEEAERVKERLSAMGLDIGETTFAWAAGVRERYFRERTAELGAAYVALVAPGRTGLDSINEPVLSSDGREINLAVLRVIPSADGRVSVRLPRWVTVLELVTLAKQLGAALGRIVNSAAGRTVEIRLEASGGGAA